MSTKNRCLAFGVALVLAISLLSVDGFAQRRHGSSPLDTLGSDEVDMDRGVEVLQTFRRLGIAGQYRLNFQLRIMPRTEKTRTVSGVLLGTMTDLGPLSRIDLALEPADISDDGKLIQAKLHRILLQNGVFANAVEWQEGEDTVGPAPVEAGQYFESIAGSDFAVFDLLMPFSYWQQFRYEGRTTMRSRPTHVYWMYPPDGDAGFKEHVSGVRIFLDDEFKMLNRVEIYDAAGEHEKTISVMSFKIVDGQAVLSRIDVRNEKTRDKTQFKVTDAALGVELPSWVFDVKGLEQAVYGTEWAAVIAKPSEGGGDSEG